MIKFLKSSRFLILFIFLSSFFKISAQKSFNFSDFDYPTETVINGQQGKTSFFIPLEEGTFLKDSKVSLNFVVPEVVNHDRSFITVALAGIPLVTKSPDEKTHEVNIELDLDSKYVSSGFLRIDVFTNLKINDELCEIYNEGVFWVRMLSSSKLIFKDKALEKKVVIPKNISESIDVINQIIIPENASINTLAYSSYIKFYFSRVFNKELEIKTFGNENLNTLDQSLVFGDLKELPELYQDLINEQNYDLDDGIVQLQIVEDDNEEVYQRNLIVTGYNNKAIEKVVEFILTEDMLRSSFTSSLAVKKGRDLTRNRKVIEFENINFSRLGVSEELIEGIGKLTREVNIPRSYFGSSVKKMELNLDLTHRPVNSKESAYLNIYFDEVLKKSFKLDNKGDFKTSLVIEDFEIKRENVIKIEFYFVPQGGMCMANATAFYAQINLEKSYLRPVSYFDTPKLNYFYFPENFQNNDINIFTDAKSTPENIEVFSELLSIINPGNLSNNDFSYPLIKPVDSLNLDKSDESKIIILNEPQQLENRFNKNAFVNFNDEVVDYRSEVYKNFFDIDYKKDLGFNQLFYFNQNPVMLITNPTNDPKVFKQLISGMRGQYLSNTGNVIVANSTSNYFFNSTDTMEKDSFETEQTSFELYWDKYRIFFVFALFLLLLVLLIYIFSKSKESKNNILDNEDK